MKIMKLYFVINVMLPFINRAMASLLFRMGRGMELSVISVINF